MTFKVAAYAFRMRRGGGGAAIRQPLIFIYWVILIVRALRAKRLTGPCGVKGPSSALAVEFLLQVAGDGLATEDLARGVQDYDSDADAGTGCGFGGHNGDSLAGG